MNIIYQKQKDIITTLFHNRDITFLLEDLDLVSQFNNSAITRIKDSGDEKVAQFFREFDAIEINTKYVNFISASSDVSDWIHCLLITEGDGDDVRKRYFASKQLISHNTEFFVDNLTFDKSTINFCLNEGLISTRTSLLLKDIAMDEDDFIAKFRLHSLLHVRSKECYCKFLQLCHHKIPVYLEIFKSDLIILLLTSSSDEEILFHIQEASQADINSFDYDPEPSVPVEAFAQLTLADNKPSVRVAAFADMTLADFFDSDDFTEDSDDCDDFNALFGVSINKTSTQLLNFQPERTESSPSTLNLREYQHELAEKGVEGKNVLICAPTSSGKTVVAIKIADEHMKAKADGKVVLVVPTTVLVDQQFALFNKYLGKSWRINKMSGGSRAFSVPLNRQISDFDILIVTCDILRNSLEDSEDSLESICEFSLIIFDECHHTDKDHSYNKVMDHYFTIKQLDLPVPQIIGMTASTGTDKAKSVEAALKFLLSLCANLDCRIVSTVTINKEELNKNLPTPSNEIRTPGQRDNDVFEICLISLMESIEVTLEGIFKKRSKTIGIPTDKYHDKYLSFVKGLTNHHPSVLSEEDSKAVKIIEIYLEYLYRALIVNHLFNASHSIQMLKEKIERKANCTCDVEVHLRQQLEEFLSSSYLDQDKNPSLECLKDEISKQITADRRSKIIIFVKEVLYTKILETEIQNAKLGFIQCKALVGTNKSSDQGGISKSETDEIVSRFRRGIINLLLATSVAEEGLDVEKCNLVMRYGHVTNEISMVQTRGRARASDSKYVVIVPHKLKWQVNKENINKIRETMMYQAITLFQNMSLKDLDVELFKLQEKRIALRQATSTPPSLVASTSTSSWSLHCIKCQSYICNSQDIRLANGTSYIVINKKAYCKLPMKTAGVNNHPVFCSNCNLPMGHVIKVEGINVPTVKIKQLQLRSGDEILKKKQWKDAPFKVEEVKCSDLLAAENDNYIPK